MAAAYGDVSLRFETQIVDRDVRRSAVERLRQANVCLPTFQELSHPARMEAPHSIRSVAPDDPRRLGVVELPGHVVLPQVLTGVEAPIVVLLGSRFPMIGAHKVLAAYACLVPRLVTGQFDPAIHKAVWPSTGNYCRGGVAISRILGCRGVAVLPTGMSRERFEWLENWVLNKRDIIRTPSTESN